MRTLAISAVATALMAIAIPSHAKDWALTFSGTSVWGGDTNVLNNLTLHIVTEDTLTLSNSPYSLGMGYKIVGFSGTRDGVAVQSVLAPGTDSFFSFGLDNYVYPGTNDLIGYQGIGYRAADGTKFNLYSASTSIMGGPPVTQWFEISSLPSTNPNFPFVTLTGDLAVAAVPEPATWALMFAGCGLMAAARRRTCKGSSTV